MYVSRLSFQRSAFKGRVHEGVSLTLKLKIHWIRIRHHHESIKSKSESTVTTENSGSRSTLPRPGCIPAWQPWDTTGPQHVAVAGNRNTRREAKITPIRPYNYERQRATVGPKFIDRTGRNMRTYNGSLAPENDIDGHGSLTCPQRPPPDRL